MTSKKKRKSDISVGALLSMHDGETCIFCLRKDNNEEDYGKFINKCGLQVHYFCMLFASGLCQRGKTEDVGIYGFLPEDIIKEIKRGSRLRCHCCKKKGSTIGCVVGSCSKKFHLGCGRQNGTLHQFFGSFRSFCQEHRPRQMVPISDRLAFYGTANALCAICMNLVEARASNDTLRAPCCRNAWFHRNCIQKHASTAGLYFFKCPLCNNKEQFQNEMLEFGIYIPDQDAAWETEPNAYNELLERYLHCDAVICRCPNGRKYNRDGGKWEIITCDWCGSAGTHEACHSLIKVGRNLVCLECKEIDDKSRKSKKLGKRKKTPVKKREAILDKKEDVDLEQKGKSEYPGPSSAIVKTSTTHSPYRLTSQCMSPRMSPGISPGMSPGMSPGLSPGMSPGMSPGISPRMSPGMVLRLSYQETDDEVNVVEDEEMSPKVRRGKHATAALGSCEQLSKRRSRARSRSSSSEYIPLSSVRQRLRSASRSARRRLRSSSRGSRQRSPSQDSSPEMAVSSKRKRSSSSESLIHKRLRSASRGRQRERSPMIVNTLRSPSRGRQRERSPIVNRLRSPSQDRQRELSPIVNRLRSTSRGRQRERSPIVNRLRSASRGRTPKRETFHHELKDRQPSPNFSRSRSTERRKSTSSSSKSAERQQSHNKSERQRPQKSPTKSKEQQQSQMSGNKSSVNSIEGKKTRSTGLMNVCDKSPSSKRSLPTLPISSPSSKQSVCDEVDGSWSSGIEKSEVHGKNKNKQRRSSKKLLISMEAELSDLPPEEQNDICIMAYQDIKTVKCTEKQVKPPSPRRHSKSPKSKRKYSKKKTKIDSKQMLINKWLTKPEDKENYQTKYLTIKWKGAQYIKMLVSPGNTTDSPTRSSPVTRSAKNSQQLTPKAIIAENLLERLSDKKIKLSDDIIERLSDKKIKLSDNEHKGKSSEKKHFEKELLEKLSEKKVGIVKHYPLRNSPKIEKAKCSLSSKFGDSCLTEKQMNCSDESDDDTLDYMDDDFLISDDTDEETDFSNAYIIKPCQNGLDQIQVVVPSGL